jgi:hypothetical protein
MACDSCFDSDPTNMPSGDGNLICDDRLMGLVSIPRVALLGVKPGTNCMAFLQETKRGFAFYDGSGLGAYIEDKPVLRLPYSNRNIPDTDFLSSGQFPFFIVGDDSFNWKMFGAPSTGQFAVVTGGGNFGLLDISNVNAVSPCSVAGRTYSGLIGCYPTGSLDIDNNPIYALTRLSLTDKRVIVGAIDPADSVVRAKTLADTDPLVHPLVRPDALTTNTYAQKDGSDVDITGGIAVLPGSVTDAVLGYYSPTVKQFFRAPAATRSTISSDANSTVNVNNTYTSISPHLDFGTLTFNYATAFIDFSVKDDAAENLTFGLFIDGNLIKEWAFSATNLTNQFSGNYIITNIAAGSHTVIIKVKTTSQPSVFKHSSASLFTLPG